MVFPKDFQDKIIARLDNGTLTWDYLKKKLELPIYSLLNLKTVVDRFRYIGINLNKELGNGGVYKNLHDKRCLKVRMKLKTKKLSKVKGPTINIKPDPEMLWNHIYKTLIK